MKGNCNKSLKLMFSRGIEDLHDDDFESSSEEDCIFKEVFFGHGSGRSSKRCLVTGAINFENENENKKPKDASFGSNSDNSVMTNHVDCHNLKLDVGQGSLSEEFTILARNGPDVEVKRRRVLPEDHLYAKPYLEKVVDSCLFQPAATMTCHLVESSGQGFKSSYYMLKGAIGDLEEKDASKCGLIGSDTNDQKGNEIKAAIASPVSQESHVSKLFVRRHESIQCSRRKWKDSSFVELDDDELLLPPKESTTDPRPLLRFHIHRLLSAAKWVIGRRNRATHCKGHGEYMYKSPEGRPIREFHRAWNMCGQKLLADANYVVGDDDGIWWTSLTQFQSDLSNTLIEMEEQLKILEPTTALAHWWYLLDPFAKLVFIDKTLRPLKEGKHVQTKRSSVNGFYMSDDAVFPLNNEAITANQATRKTGKESSSLVPFPAPICRSDTMSCHPVSSTTANASTGGSESIYLHQDGRDLGFGCNEDDGQFNGAQEADVYTKEHKKSKKIFEMKLSDPYSLQDTSEISYQLKSNMERQSVGTNAENYGSCRKPSFCSSEEQHEKKQSRFENSVHRFGSPGKLLRCEKDHRPEKAEEVNCHLDDDDLLLSAILLTGSTTNSSGNKKKPCVPKAPRKYSKGPKGSCKLRPRSLTKGGQPRMEGRWSGLGVRSVLSWLIDFGVIHVNEVIQYRNPRDVVKDGIVTRDGIVCRCCEKTLSVSEFKNHAGFSLRSLCINLYMESGKPFTLCQLEAWSAEYKVRRGAARTVQVEEVDEHDDTCGLCGDGGDLICCDNCPSTFHLTCLCVEELPKGNWYCSKCSCWICGNVVNDNEASITGALKCLQCEHKYHEECLRENGMGTEELSSTWFCAESCKQVHSGLHSLIGIMNPISDTFSWTLLKCIYGDQKVHSDQYFVECNLKLAVALTIMEECFLPMVDPRSGIDMIPHAVYNWGSEFARLNYEGFYTMILETDDVILCVASLRIHGTTLAEMPLIATCSKYRRQGMCRRLMGAIEEMLKSFKVEKLVVSAIPSLVDTWTNCFGFTPLKDDEKQSLTKTSLMVFPETVWLQKPMYQGTPTEEPLPLNPNPNPEGATTYLEEKLGYVVLQEYEQPELEPPLKTEGGSFDTGLK